MLRVGLTGGYASGKSFVGAKLVELGCHLLQADEAGHLVLQPGGEAYEPVVKEFGKGILNPDGTINRRLLAAEVFDKPERLATLNSLVHPPVIRREEAFMAEVATHDPHGIAVVEAAILIETGSYKRFDRVIVTVCDEECQIKRAMHRDGLSREEILARLRRQMPLGEKQKYADYVIDTSESKDDTVKKVEAVYTSLRSTQR
jgi:dephospho-CoA kinase